MKLTGNQSSHLKNEERTTHKLESPAIQGSRQPLSRTIPQNTGVAKTHLGCRRYSRVRLPGDTRVNEHMAHTSRPSAVLPPRHLGPPGRSGAALGRQARSAPVGIGHLGTQAGGAELGNTETKPARPAGRPRFTAPRSVSRAAAAALRTAVSAYTGPSQERPSQFCLSVRRAS